MPNIRRKLIEAIDCFGNNDIAVLIVRFYDEYMSENAIANKLVNLDEIKNV